MQGLRASDEAIDPRDPEFSPLGAHSAVPPYLAGDPAYDPAAAQYDPAASQYNTGGYDDPYSDPYSGGQYDAYYGAQPGGQDASAYGDDSSYHGAAGDAAAVDAAQVPVSDGARHISAFSIEQATPPPQQLGPDGRPRHTVRRSSIEVRRSRNCDLINEISSETASPCVSRDALQDFETALTAGLPQCFNTGGLPADGLRAACRIRRRRLCRPSHSDAAS